MKKVEAETQGSVWTEESVLQGLPSSVHIWPFSHPTLYEGSFALKSDFGILTHCPALRTEPNLWQLGSLQVLIPDSRPLNFSNCDLIDKARKNKPGRKGT